MTPRLGGWSRKRTRRTLVEDWSGWSSCVRQDLIAFLVARGIDPAIAHDVTIGASFDPATFLGTRIEFPTWIDRACRQQADRAVAGLPVTPETIQRHEDVLADIRRVARP